MFFQPAPVIVHPDLFHAFVRKMIRDIARGDNGEAEAVGNQTLAMFAVVCKKLNKFMRKRLTSRFYTGRPHHPLVVLSDITRMKEYRQRVIEGMHQAIKELAPNVSSDYIEIRSMPVLQFFVKTGDNFHGRVWVKKITPSLISVHVHSVSNQRFRKETEFDVYVTFDTQGRYVVVDDVHGNRITRLDFHELLRQRITAAINRGDVLLA
jgi:hypothetical protein